jgi:hypothetical protein
MPAVPQEHRATIRTGLSRWNPARCGETIRWLTVAFAKHTVAKNMIRTLRASLNTFVLFLVLLAALIGHFIAACNGLGSGFDWGILTLAAYVIDAPFFFFFITVVIFALMFALESFLESSANSRMLRAILYASPAAAGMAGYAVSAALSMKARCYFGGF